MRASKERAEEARQALAEVSDILEPLWSGNGVLKLNALGFRKLDANLTWIGEFLNTVKRRLPTEAAYDRDSTRRRRIVGTPIPAPLPLDATEGQLRDNVGRRNVSKAKVRARFGV